MLKFSTLLLLFFSITASAQMIKGRILIYGSESPLANASIYYDGMYRGGISDEGGNFQLASAASAKTPIVISAVGYHSVSISNYSPQNLITVYLQPKVYALEGVVVSYDGMSREDKEAIFKREFIGTSENSAQCEILNMDDIELVFNKKKQSVEAFCEKPIILYNKALGFKISYYLADFISSPGGRIYFAGNYFFEEDSILKGRDLSAIIKKREDAYLGSRMHFIRALYNNDLKGEGFVVHTTFKGLVDYKHIIVDVGSNKSISLSSGVTIIYKGEAENPTHLVKKKDLTYIEQNGFYDPSGLTWSGYMANQRMGDLLPFEYQPPKR